jgi:hypothetical protein
MIVSLVQGTGEEVYFMDTFLCSMHDQGLNMSDIEIMFSGNIDAPARVPRGSTQVLWESSAMIIVFDIGVRRGRAYN